MIKITIIISLLQQDAPLDADSELHKFAEFKYPNLKISADFMEDIIPYNFVPFLGPFQGFNWESVAHIMPMSQLKIGETYDQSSSKTSKKRKLNNNSDKRENKKNDDNNGKNSDNKIDINNSKNTDPSSKNEESPHQNQHKELIEKFKKDCVWWGWTILDPSQLGTTFINFHTVFDRIENLIL